MHFIFPPPPPATLPILSTSPLQQHFPVRNIYCVGQNYRQHAQEMGSSGKEPPFFFHKALDCLVAAPSFLPKTNEVTFFHPIHYPLGSQNVHHEVELVLAIGEHPQQKTATCLTPEETNDFIFGYAIGLDLTRRDLQAKLKETQRPWDLAKSFIEAAPISAITPKDQIGFLIEGEIKLTVNGTVKQKAQLSEMIWDASHLLAALSRYYPLQPGDLVFTGTPAGVGSIQVGDQIIASITGLPDLCVTVVA